MILRVKRDFEGVTVRSTDLEGIRGPWDKNI